jgi:hypothetical protein
MRGRLEAAARLLTPAQETVFAERAGLEQEVVTSVNAKRKKAQMALNRWLAEHDSKDMGLLTKRYEDLRVLRKDVRLLETQIEEWDAAPLLCLEPLEACLTAWGFLGPAGLAASEATSSSTKCATLSLTPLGVMASESNEGHQILMPLLAASGKAADLTSEEIACVLAAFLQEGADRDDAPSLDSANLGSSAREALGWIDTKAKECQRFEDSQKVFSPPGFWNLSPLWICVASRWLAGDGLTQIANEFGLFEGNVQRALLRIASLLEEWGAIATLRKDLATLEKLAALRFLRNEVIVDSLYLRI